MPENLTSKLDTICCMFMYKFQRWVHTCWLYERPQW